MNLNVPQLNKLIDERFGRNQSAFARAIGVDRGQISRVLSHGDRVGRKFFGALMKFCKRNNLEFDSYIFLSENAKKVNTITKEEGENEKFTSN